jgi:hypothetical protein
MLVSWVQDFIQDDIETHRQADEMNTDLEIITLREASQTALEVQPLQRSSDSGLSCMSSSPELRLLQDLPEHQAVYLS